MEMRPSAARSFEVDLSGSGWDRIAGYRKEIEYLKEMLLWPLSNISTLSDLGVSHPDGLLITGPPAREDSHGQVIGKRERIQCD